MDLVKKLDEKLDEKQYVGKIKFDTSKTSEVRILMLEQAVVDLNKKFRDLELKVIKNTFRR